MTATSDEQEPKEPGQENRTSPHRAVRLIDGRIDSRELFVGTREIMIGHGGELYRLRLTAQNKLILTK